MINSIGNQTKADQAVVLFQSIAITIFRAKPIASLSFVYDLSEKNLSSNVFGSTLRN